jgi:hypothetical protein
MVQARAWFPGSAGYCSGWFGCCNPSQAKASLNGSVRNSAKEGDVVTFFASKTLRDVPSHVDFSVLKAIQVPGLDCYNTFLMNQNHFNKWLFGSFIHFFLRNAYGLGD